MLGWGWEGVIRNGGGSLGLRWNKRGIRPRLGLLGLFSPDAGATGLGGSVFSERSTAGECFPVARRKIFVTDSFSGCSSLVCSLEDLPLEGDLDVRPVRGKVHEEERVIREREKHTMAGGYSWHNWSLDGHRRGIRVMLKRALPQ